jgi:hypothetical protein
VIKALGPDWQSLREEERNTYPVIGRVGKRKHDDGDVMYDSADIFESQRSSKFRQLCSLVPK